MATAAAPEQLAERGRHFGEARIRAVREVASDVRMLEIEPAGGVRPYPTGSHLDIAVEVDGLPDVRSYSLVGEGPVDGAYRIAVKDIPDTRGGSVYVRALEPGTDVHVSEPKSHFELQWGRSEYLLVAGGIGITPIIGMARALERHGRPFRLLFDGASFVARDDHGALRLDAADVAVRVKDKQLLAPTSLAIEPGELIAMSAPAAACP